MNNIHVVMIPSDYLKSVSSFDNLNNMNFKNEQQVWDHLINSDYFEDDVDVFEVTSILTLQNFMYYFNDMEANDKFIAFVTIDEH